MTEAVAVRTLSKSDFTLGRTCPTKLYYRELGYPNVDEADEYLQMLAAGGYMVETAAKLRYPDGIALKYGGNVQTDAQATAEHLAKDRVTLFEATLLSGNKQARVDILEKSGNVFRIVEVKAKSFDSAENLLRLLDGKPSVFRSTRRPFPIVSEWDPYIADIAYQVLLLRERHPTATINPFLCLVDKSKTTKIDGLPGWFRVERRLNRAGIESVHHVEFTGDVECMRRDDILTEVDVSEEVECVMPSVMEMAAEFEGSLIPELRKLPAQIGVQCKHCEYRFTEPTERHGFAECWGDLAEVRPSVLDLYRVSDKTVAAAVAAKQASLLEVPMDSLTKSDGSIGNTAFRQITQIVSTRSRTTWYDKALRETVESATYPLHFIDFEAARLAIPPHAGMRPYGLLAFQWSCHTVGQGPEGGGPRYGGLAHSEWLNTSDYWPNAEFARSLRRQVGDTGTVLAWAPFEASVLKDVLKELTPSGQSDPELEEWIAWITADGRILDLNKVTLDHFFHPDMGGRTSIKVVLDALWRSDDAMRARFAEVMGREGDRIKGPYAALPSLEINGKVQQVIEGTGAIRAYEAMMYGAEREDQETKDRWGRLLKQYCALDTLAMVLIWEYWERLTAGTGAQG